MDHAGLEQLAVDGHRGAAAAEVNRVARNSSSSKGITTVSGSSTGTRSYCRRSRIMSRQHHTPPFATQAPFAAC